MLKIEQNLSDFQIFENHKVISFLFWILRHDFEKLFDFGQQKHIFGKNTQNFGFQNRPVAFANWM